MADEARGQPDCPKCGGRGYTMHRDRHGHAHRRWYAVRCDCVMGRLWDYLPGEPKMDESWRNGIIKPEKPVGLEAFLEETGL
jgi:hypothetical protein